MNMSACQPREPEPGAMTGADVAKGFSQAAGSYNSIAKIQQRIARDALANVKLRPDTTILDIGCGTGMHTSWLQKEGAKAVGVDVAEGMARFARQQNCAVPFIVGDAGKLPFCSHSFANVFSSMALQWCPDPRLPLAEIYRVLKVKGRATLAIMVAGSFMELDRARVMANLEPTTNAMDEHDKWVQFARAAGLSVIGAECRSYTDSFEHVLPLLRSIARIGAGTRIAKQQRPPLTKADIRRLQIAYLQQADEEGRLPLTYRVSHLVLEK